MHVRFFLINVIVFSQDFDSCTMKKLCLNSIPPVYNTKAIAYSNFWQSWQGSFQLSVVLLKLVNQPALGLSAGPERTVCQSREVKLPRGARFTNCTHGWTEGTERLTVGHRVVVSPPWWITWRDSSLDPLVLTRGGEHTSHWVIYERLQAQMWICRRWQSEGRQTSAYQREELKGAAPGETHHFHINTCAQPAL